MAHESGSRSSRANQFLNDESSDSLLTIEDVAKILRLKKKHVEYLVREKKIPHTRISERKVRIPLGRLRDWLNQRTC